MRQDIRQAAGPRHFFLCLFFLVVFSVSAQDAAVAERYAAWAAAIMAEGRWAEAEHILERAQDYADVSSDLSYLLAQVRFHENRPQALVLEPVRLALETGRWDRYTQEAARLLEGRCLIRLRAYAEALQSLSAAGENADAACLRLTALRFLPDLYRFREAAAHAMDRYPQDPRPLAVLFAYGADKLPQGNDLSLIETALRRLPPLVEEHPDLIPPALPFIRDAEDVRRLLASYRALGGKSPAAVREALKFGLISEDQALTELFTPETPGAELVLDKELAGSLWGLLREKASRNRFSRLLSSFSGLITEDRDGDGYPESRTAYQEGLIQSFDYDPDQDGLWDVQISFSAGFPVRGTAAVETGAGRTAAFLYWERYPALLRVECEGVTYVPRPREFSFAPVKFSSFTGEGPAALLYPEAETPLSRLNRRTLASFSHTVERPSAEFKGAVLRVELERGIPVRAAEWLGSRLVSVTEFSAGTPRIQRVDLDLDGRLETVRRFRGEGILDTSESDWDGDGIYETGETYLPDGGIIRSWDMNKDGIREYSEAAVEDLR